MKDKNVIFSLCLILVVLAIVISRIQHEPRPKEAFERNPSKLSYSKDAICLMDCLQISKEDINEIMQKGIINFSRSDRNNRPCPSFTLQGKTNMGKKLRVLFAQCPEETTVITVYNLKRDIECDCPGDSLK